MKLADQHPDNPEVQRLTAKARALLHQYCGNDDYVPLPWVADEKRERLWSAAVKVLTQATDTASNK
jgi:hypothetical protein